MSATAEQLQQNTIEPGVYNDISNAAYHSGPGLSSSAIKELLKSPAHYRQTYILGKKKSETDAMRRGSLVHTLVLEPELADAEYMIVEASTRSTKIFKNAKAEFPGKTVVLAHEYELAESMAAAVLSHDLAVSILQGSLREHSIYWDEGGVLAKCRPDIWQPNMGITADLKTAADASPEGFAKAVFRYGYDVSAAWYSRGILRTQGAYPKSWAWIVVEPEPPHAVQVYAADPAVLERGTRRCDHALERLTECQQNDHWPAYSDQIMTITLPAWLQE